MPSITTLSISQAEVTKLLCLEENHFCDLKSIQISPAKLTKTISAFANAEGGELFIGVEDTPRKWLGFTNEEAANGHIQAFETLFPLGNDYDYQFLRTGNEHGLVLKISVAKTRNIVKASSEKIFIRRGAQSLPVTDDARLDSLKRDKGLSSYETEPVNCPHELVTNSEPIISFLLEVVPTAEPKAWLEK